MSRKTAFPILVLSILLLGCLAAQATPVPDWTWKGEGALNKKRTSDGYSFKVFKTEDQSMTRLHEGRFYPLLAYLGDRYGVDINKMSLDSLSAGPGEPYTYRIVIPENERDATVWAQRVDVYSDVDNNTLGDPIFEYYQLYAVSEKDADAFFDQFEVKERSRGGAALMTALVPGAGQIYKGHTFKGGAILGSEIVLGAAAWSAHKKSLYYRDMVTSGTPSTDSLQRKEIGMRRLRNTALIAMGGIWAFGLFDALATESMPFLYVSAPQGGQLTVAPSQTGAGLSLVYRF